MPFNAVESRSQEANSKGTLTDTDLISMYRIMVLSRHVDERIWQMNRQGKAAIAASARGHEAAQVASIWATQPEHDHYLIYYRQLTAMLALGVTPKELLLGFLAKDGDPMSNARQFPLHGSLDRSDAFSFSNVVGTQIPQAAGVALADQMRGEKRVTLVYFGDGASSTGDCHEGMNFAGVHNLPVVFFCENNGYAISVPLEKQTRIANVSGRASAYGFSGITVDGMDPIAVFEAVYSATEKARTGGGPALIEVLVDRLLPHTTDDDHTRYRPRNELETMDERDPIIYFETMLKLRKILDDLTITKIQDESKTLVDSATSSAEAAGFPDPSTMYDHLMADRLTR